jgi:iron complex transport system substrate-binding protein
MIPRVALLLLATGLLSVSCERSDKPPAPASAPATQASPTPPDRVAAPYIDPTEAEGPCPRILSTAPNITEICCALGLVDCLIGRTRYCTHPPAVQRVPSIGALNDLNTEVLISLQPDLILVAGTSRAISERLARLDLTFESLPDDTLQDLLTAIERVGTLVARPRTARDLIRGITHDLEAVARRYANTPSARVLLTIAPMPDPPTQVYVAGPGSFHADLLRRANHQNVAQPAGQPYAPVSLEFILHADPDVIIEIVPDNTPGRLPGPRGDVQARAAWQRVGPLRALDSGRVHTLHGSRHLVLGPRIAQTFEALCATMAASDE